MGGIARLIRKLPMVKAIAPKVAAPQPAPVAATATKAPAVATVLGGATKKKKQTNNFGY